MSAVDVIEQIKKLPREEQAKVAEFVHEAEISGELQLPDRRVSSEFKRVADEVFTNNADLFRKLAQ
ncbi:MAG: hypothetical protein IH623_07740 [Verrucomicrobia bacterium]|nr:hypothetical protein [Verrucomicrobiota bacterium]